MSYTWHRFEAFDGGVYTLPTGLPDEDIDTGQAELVFDDLASGGALDTLGTADAWPGATEMSRTALLVAASSTALRTAFDALLAMANKAGKLYRRDVASGAEQWCYVRMGRVRAGYAPSNLRHLEVETPCVRLSRSWYGTTLRTIPIVDIVPDTDDLPAIGAETTSTSTIAFMLRNYGNAAVHNVVLELTAGPGGIAGTPPPATGIGITCGAGSVIAQWSWLGTLAEGQKLRIDTGARAVTRITTLTSGASVGATSLSVGNTTGFTPGDLIEIESTSGRLVQRTIATVPNSTTITFATALTGAAASGARVIVSAYSGFALTADHTMSDWLRLAPGFNTLYIAFEPLAEHVGQITYYDGYN